MYRLKKMIIVTLILALALVGVACSSGSVNETASDNSNNDSSNTSSDGKNNQQEVVIKLAHENKTYRVYMLQSLKS
jgi:ABC-type Fe3+-citrate transport system substrate-binding protein